MAKPKDLYLVGFHNPEAKPVDLVVEDIEFYAIGPKEQIEDEIRERVEQGEHAGGNNNIVFKMVPVRVKLDVDVRVNGKIKTRKRKRKVLD